MEGGESRQEAEAGAPFVSPDGTNSGRISTLQTTDADQLEGTWSKKLAQHPKFPTPLQLDPEKNVCAPVCARVRARVW